jgi:hypothetical protein
MATRAFIAMALGDDGSESVKFRAVYLHSDGGPEWAGKTLLHHYSDHDHAERLLNLGNLSELAPSLGASSPDHTVGHAVKGWTVAYARDRGDEDMEATEHDSFADLVQSAQDSDAEFLYVKLDDRWLWSPIDSRGLTAGPSTLFDMQNLTETAILPEEVQLAQLVVEMSKGELTSVESVTNSARDWLRLLRSHPEDAIRIRAWKGQLTRAYWTLRCWTHHGKSRRTTDLLAQYHRNGQIAEAPEMEVA